MKYRRLKKLYNSLELKYLTLLEDYNEKMNWAFEKIQRNEKVYEENRRLRKKIRDLKKLMK